MRHLFPTIALALLTPMCAAPAAAQTAPALTLTNLKAPIARASGKAEARSTAELWTQVNGLNPAAAPIPPSIEQRLDRIEAAVARIGTVGPVTPTPVPVASALPAMDYDARLWEWDRRWHTSEWGNGLSPIPWKYDHVQVRGTDVVFRLDGSGAPEAKAQNGTPWQTSGTWEADVTLPTLRPGVIVAPLWLYNGDTADEIDFEVAGTNGLDITLHERGGRKSGTKVFAGQNLSGKRLRLGIRMGADKIDMLVDGKVEHSFARNLITSPVKPVISMWAADPNNGGFVGWAGRFQPFATGEGMEMTVHGYRYSAN